MDDFAGFAEFTHSIEEACLITKSATKQRFRRSIFESWQRKCAYCHDYADTLDHVRPRHRGGLTARSNLVPACRECNLSKGSEDWRQWFRAQDFYLLDRESAIDQWINQCR